MCLYIIMPFSSNFYLFVFGNVIENRMTKKQGIPLAKGVGGCSIGYGTVVFEAMQSKHPPCPLHKGEKKTQNS